MLGENALVQAAVDGLQTAAYLTDDESRILALNAKADKLLARSGAQLLSQDVHDALHRNHFGAPLPRSMCAFREAVLNEQAAHGEQEWLERGDGTLLPVSWFSTPFEYAGRRPGTLVMFWPRDEPERVNERSRQLMSSLTQLERLALLAETTTQLSATLDVEETLQSLVRLVVPRLADWAVVDLITESNEVWRSIVAHAQDGTLVARDDLQGPMPPVTEDSPMPLSRALRGASSSLAGPETYQGPPDAGIAVEQRRLFETTGIHSAIITPIHTRRRTLGALTLGRSGPSEKFTVTDLGLLEDIGRRADWHWTTPCSTGASARSPKPCNATCCHAYPGSRAWR